MSGIQDRVVAQRARAEAGSRDGAHYENEALDIVAKLVKSDKAKGNKSIPSM